MVQRCKFSIELKNFPPDLSGEPNIDWMTRYTSLGIRNNEHPVLHSEDKTSPETGIRKRDGNAYPARYNERRNRKNEKGSKHRLCACNFRQVGQESRFIIFIDDMFGKE